MQPNQTKCGVCANRGAPYKVCVAGDKFRVLPKSSCTGWHTPRTVQGAEFEIPNKAIR